MARQLPSTAGRGSGKLKTTPVQKRQCGRKLPTEVQPPSLPASRRSRNQSSSRDPAQLLGSGKSTPIEALLRCWSADHVKQESRVILGQGHLALGLTLLTEVQALSSQASQRNGKQSNIQGQGLQQVFGLRLQTEVLELFFPAGRPSQKADKGVLDQVLQGWQCLHLQLQAEQRIGR